MDFERPLIPGRLIQRYKRFLADVDLEDGRRVTAHCANPGSMMGLKSPGLRVWLQPVDNPKRKLKFDLQLVEMPSGALVGINTSVPNRIVGEALRDYQIPELTEYPHIVPEQRYGSNSRIDFLLQADDRPSCYVEVKNVHLMREEGLAEFPDSVTTRGAKHLKDLADVASAGGRSVMLYVVQRDDCDRMSLAPDLDPAYAQAFDNARQQGVEALVYRAKLSTKRIKLDGALPLVAC
ncbi:MAG: DNA/RNA nuclease SfsA [Pseudomonadota bacterium]